VIFVAMGFFKAGIDPAPPELQAALNEHLAQPIRHIRLAGYLRGEDGGRKGFMVVLEVAGFEEAGAYLKSSPYFAADLYERVEVVEYAIEVGRLE
jgi:uncharacterized protein YciI